MKMKRFAHLIQNVATEKNLTNEKLAWKVGLKPSTARTLRWGDRMHLSASLVERCIKKLNLPPKTARALAAEQNEFCRSIIEKSLRRRHKKAA